MKTSHITNNIIDQAATQIPTYPLNKHSHSLIQQSLAVSFLSLLVTLPVYADSAATIQQRVITGKSATEHNNSVFLGNGAQSYALNVPRLQIDLTSSETEGHKTGGVYSLPEPVSANQLQWEKVQGGYVARVKTHAEQAKRLRHHLVFSQEIPSIVIRLAGNQDVYPLTPIEQQHIHDKAIWLPITNGNQADLELFVDDHTPPTATFSIDAVNVIVEEFKDQNSLGVKPKSLGKAQEKEYDLACAAKSADYQALQQAASATALIHFVKNGSTYTCTGTLLNDQKNSGTPWFATANHCISDQATADSATFEWFYQSVSCNGQTTDSRYEQTYGGAQLLWADQYYDGAFLKLNAQPPNGTFFMGWDTTIQVGEYVWGVHHPKGDHTMVSFGQVSILRQTIDNTYGQAIFTNRVDYVEGGTESGSSGSGLFSVVDGSALWKGTLFGGPEDYRISLYSDFNSYYPNIKQWLAGLSNTAIDQLYTTYQNYFGEKYGNTYTCYENYTCQDFVNGRAIAQDNYSNVLYWYDGIKWNFYG